MVADWPVAEWRRAAGRVIGLLALGCVAGCVRTPDAPMRAMREISRPIDGRQEIVAGAAAGLAAALEARKLLAPPDECRPRPPPRGPTRTEPIQYGPCKPSALPRAPGPTGRPLR